MSRSKRVLAAENVGDRAAPEMGRPPSAAPESHCAEVNPMEAIAGGNDIAALVAALRAESMVGPLLKTEEAAKYLAISPRQVQYLCDRGELPCIKMATSTRYSPADLDEFIDHCRRKGGRS